MRIALLPLDIVPLDPIANIGRAEMALTHIDRQADVVVLPELFTTGFSADASAMERMAETISGTAMQIVGRWAKELNMAIAGTFLSRTGHSLYNRAFFIEPSGEETFYDKHHLFMLGAENQILKPGMRRCPIVRFRGWEMTMVTCYDIRFPAWCRNDRNPRYDVLLVPANWPTARAFAWETLLRARAIENVAYVMGANRSGRQGDDVYDNLSYAVDFLGRDCALPDGDAQHPQSQFIYADLDRDKLDRFRRAFPVLDDIG